VCLGGQKPRGWRPAWVRQRSVTSVAVPAPCWGHRAGAGVRGAQQGQNSSWRGKHAEINTALLSRSHRTAARCVNCELRAEKGTTGELKHAASGERKKKPKLPGPRTSQHPAPSPAPSPHSRFPSAFVPGAGGTDATGMIPTRGSEGGRCRGFDGLGGAAAPFTGALPVLREGDGWSSTAHGDGGDRVGSGSDPQLAGVPGGEGEAPTAARSGAVSPPALDPMCRNQAAAPTPCTV